MAIRAASRPWPELPAGEGALAGLGGLRASGASAGGGSRAGEGRLLAPPSVTDWAVVPQEPATTPC